MRSTNQRLRRVWARALVACALYFVAALAVTGLTGGFGSRRQRATREEAPEYVMPSGERRRAVVFTRAEPPRAADRRAGGVLVWWCGILAVATLAGATAQTMRIRAEARRGAA